jgi:hypothetical protein
VEKFVASQNNNTPKNIHLECYKKLLLLLNWSLSVTNGAREQGATDL